VVGFVHQYDGRHNGFAEDQYWLNGPLLTKKKIISKALICLHKSLHAILTEKKS
jgi:hypothetical protein